MHLKIDTETNQMLKELLQYPGWVEDFEFKDEDACIKEAIKRLHELYFYPETSSTEE